ncbi:hypothetical protein [Synechococcus sp. UW140]|uniref:hypothetical protein n=1 Tax=Synechococcus sp. UW140 TaxID=368503 RepID=UPI0010BD2EB2|nr:hypothetical protein [Synechococcus sp. UW140]
MAAAVTSAIRFNPARRATLLTKVLKLIQRHACDLKSINKNEMPRRRKSSNAQLNLANKQSIRRYTLSSAIFRVACHQDKRPGQNDRCQAATETKWLGSTTLPIKAKNKASTTPNRHNPTPNRLAVEEQV